MNIERIYKKLDDLVVELRYQQEQELTANNSPVGIAENIIKMESAKEEIKTLFSKLEEIGIHGNLSDCEALKDLVE